jgi:hydroxymethylpyrimidine pyrophosphatase-like HAD family hydrolase
LLSNNQIVERIYKDINIKKMVNKVICQSYNSSDEDLVQHIYLTLLEMDNEKLNYLYENHLMGPWIMQIILNNRNYYRSQYQLYFNIKDNPTITEDIQDDSDDLKEEQLALLDEIISRYNIESFSGYTIQQKWEFTSLELLKIYVNRKHSFTSLSKALKISRNTVNETLKYARNFIKKEYDKND